MSALRHGSLETADGLAVGQSVILYDGHLLTYQGWADEPILDFAGWHRAVSLGACTYIGERDADGWIHAPEGGWSSNPVPGMRVNVRQRGYKNDDDATWLSDDQHWSEPDLRDAFNGHDIIAFRLAHPAPEQVANGRDEANRWAFSYFPKDDLQGRNMRTAFRLGWGHVTDPRQHPNHDKPAPQESGEPLSPVVSPEQVAEAQDAAVGGLLGLEAVISEADVIRVHGYANFGSMTPREVVNDGVRKYAVGYSGGHTQLCILMEHGLITKPRPGRYDASLTKKGKQYARALWRFDEAEAASVIRRLRSELAVARERVSE